VHISNDLDRSEREHGCLRFTDQIMFPALEIQHSLDPFTSMHHFIIHVVSLLSFVTSLLCSKRQEESGPK
jgi:hypothetical protein